MYARGHRFLLIQQGKSGNFSHVPAQRLHQLLTDQVTTYRHHRTPSAAVAPKGVTAYFRAVDPGTLVRANVNKQEDTSKNTIHLIDASIAQPKHQSIQVFRPELPSQWVHQAVRPQEGLVHYQIGPWVVEQGRAGYINVFGSTRPELKVNSGHFEKTTGREVLHPDYQALCKHMMTGAKAVTGDRQINSLVRQMLRGGGETADIPASLAVVVAAYFIAETGRQPTTHLINLMAMDLVDRGPLIWKELLLENAHPIGRGSGVAEYDTVGKAMEADLAIAWLEGQSSSEKMAFVGSQYSDGCPPADQASEQAIATLFQHRMDCFANANECIKQGHTLPTSTDKGSG